jgi:hypothetical protein
VNHKSNQGAGLKTISIHGLAEEAEKLLKERAKSGRKSVNKTVKEILEKSLGLGPAPKDHRDEFVDLCGLWTEDEEKRFHAAIKDLGKVNPADWK